jgi:hypothetical protein
MRNLQLEPCLKMPKKKKKGKKMVSAVYESEALEKKWMLWKASPTAMRILSWNCKGLSRPAVVLTLRRLIWDQSPDIIFLFETKIPPTSLCCFEHT